MPKFIIELDIHEGETKELYDELNDLLIYYTIIFNRSYFSQIHLADFDDYKCLSKKQIEELKTKGRLYWEDLKASDGHSKWDTAENFTVKDILH